jgi:hypothetical protein
VRDAKVAPVPPGTLLLDTDQVVSEAALDQAWAHGVRGILRYVGFGLRPWVGDLTLGERDRILARGMGLMVVQHVRDDPWMPTEAWGISDGDAAVRHALAAGYLPGATLWSDLEGIERDAVDATVSYANAKHASVASAGFEPGEYIGSGCPLGSEALYHLLLSSIYWRAGSVVPDVACRGYAMRQQIPGPSFAGISFDKNEHTGDRLGGSAHWIVPADAPADVA